MPMAKKTPNMTAPARAASAIANALIAMQNTASRNGRKANDGRTKGVSSSGDANDPPAIVAANNELSADRGRKVTTKLWTQI